MHLNLAPKFYNIFALFSFFNSPQKIHILCVKNEEFRIISLKNFVIPTVDNQEIHNRAQFNFNEIGVSPRIPTLFLNQKQWGKLLSSITKSKRVITSNPPENPVFPKYL